MPLRHELRDGAHHFLGDLTVTLLPPLVTHRLEDEGGAEGHGDGGGTRERATGGERPRCPRHVDGHHGRTAQDRQHARAWFPLAQPSLHPACALGEQEYRTVLA